MQHTIWLSYDLGVRGDYATLYRWLDEVNAAECGDGLAYFKIEIPSDETPPDFIKRMLHSNISLSKTDRVYVIWRGQDSCNHGKFIIGGRKASPWQGYNPLALSEDDT